VAWKAQWLEEGWIVSIAGTSDRRSFPPNKYVRKNSEQRIIMLFADYRGILRNHGLAWIVDENPKPAVNHIVDALKPSILKKRIKDDLTFGHIGLRKDFLGFMRHVIRRAEHYSDYEEPTDPYHKLGKPNSVTGTNTGTTSPSTGSCRGSRNPAANTANTQSTQLERAGPKTRRIA
jgi:hypothetical protein